MKNWISALVAFFLGTSLAGCSSMSSTNNGQQASHPLAPVATEAKMTAEAKTMPAKAPVQSANDKKLADIKEKPAEESGTTDKFLSLWRDMPSIQWFVNDMKQQDVG